MATRLYLNESRSAAFNIGASVSTLWEQNIAGAFTTKRAQTATDGNSNVSHVTSSLGSGSNPCDICFGQFMTDELPSGVLINGTVSGNMVVREGNTSDNLYSQIGVYVVNSSGVLVHTLWAGSNGSSSGGGEWNSPSANNRNIPPGGAQSLTSYTTVNATSRVVIEIGCRTESTRTTVQAYMYFGGGNGTDLPSGDGGDNSTTKSPWIEFSADIFTPPAGGGAKSRAAIAMSGYHDDPEWQRRPSGLFVRP